MDSGGEGGAGYSANEDYILVLCPSEPGTAIALEWIEFQLATMGEGPYDVMRIHDGPSTSSPLLATWQGFWEPGTIAASYNNTSGCLTLQFTSNASGYGTFSAEISCITPCEPPTPVVSISGISGSPYLVCQNEVISLDASASTAANGANITNYEWIFGDGAVDSESGPMSEHSYPYAGAYQVQLVLTDDGGCESVAPIDVLVRVSTTPDFMINEPQEDSFCLGTSVQLDATGTSSTAWEPASVPRFEGTEQILDGTFVVSRFDTTFSSAELGSIISSVDQLGSICVEMEHSYLGDLSIKMRCPNGQEMVLHQTAAGATFLGSPFDTEDGQIGECWAYCWSPGATNGTWWDNSTFGDTPNLMPGGIDNIGESLIPGTYEPEGDFGDLVGCPINGEWTLIILDDAFLDDGYLCSWNFDIFAGASTLGFEPGVGLSSIDSAHWSGSGIALLPATPTVANAVPLTGGVLDYVFTVLDHFGCSYDTTITVSVVDPLITSITGPIVPPANGAEVVYEVSTAHGDSINWILPEGWAWANEVDTTSSTVSLIPPTTIGSYLLCASVITEACASEPFCISIGVGGTLSMHEATGQEAVKVHPVPSAGALWVDRPDNGIALAQLFDINGRLVSYHSLSSIRDKLELGALPNGAYRLVIQEAGRIATRTVILER